MAESENPQADSSPSITHQMASFCTNILHCIVSDHDISVAHSLTNHGNSDNYRNAVIVCFVQQSIYNEAYVARRLKDYRTPANKIYINEDLTATNKKIFGAARRKL